MRFAIALSDPYETVLNTLLSSGWEWCRLFVSPGDWLHDNRNVVELAMKRNVPIQYSPVVSQDLAMLGASGCDALVVASYPFRIPDWENHLKYAINLHPSPLPEARGPYPLVRAILEEKTAWAVTCHRISHDFDRGDILDAESFALDADETHETLCLKSQLAAARLAGRIGANIDGLWQTAVPQHEGSYWKCWTVQDRTVDFDQPVQTIMRQVRAFGDIECLATVNDITIYIHRANGWIALHSARVGTVVHISNLALVIAARDGYIAVTEWSFTAPGATIGRLRRQ